MIDGLRPMRTDVELRQHLGRTIAEAVNLLRERHCVKVGRLRHFPILAPMPTRSEER
jgi:hypothetical protein